MKTPPLANISSTLPRRSLGVSGCFVRWSSSSSSAPSIYLSSMSDRQNKQDKFRFPDLVNDPVVSHADSIQIGRTGEFNAPGRARLLFEAVNCCAQPLIKRCIRQLRKKLFSSGAEIDQISHPVSLSPLAMGAVLPAEPEFRARLSDQQCSRALPIDSSPQSMTGHVERELRRDAVILRSPRPRQRCSYKKFPTPVSRVNPNQINQETRKPGKKRSDVLGFLAFGSPNPFSSPRMIHLRAGAPACQARITRIRQRVNQFTFSFRFPVASSAKALAAAGSGIRNFFPLSPRTPKSIPPHALEESQPAII